MPLYTGCGMKKNQQDTLFGEKPFRVLSKKMVKHGSLKFYEPSKETPEAIMQDLEELHGRTRFFAMFSGGKDSMSVAHKLSEMGKLDSVVHIKTGVGLQITEDFVRDICQEMGWRLHIIEPNPKYTYASHVLQYGFPGPAFHSMIMSKLKFRTMRDFALSIDRKGHCLITGIRKFESQRRMGKYPRPIQTDGVLWYGCPLFYESNESIYKYVHENGLKISPAYKAGFGTSGECNCGAFATAGTKQKIMELDPKLAEYIKWLEDGISRFGTAHAKAYATWGGVGKMSDLENQQQMDSFFAENPELKQSDEFEKTICGSECGPGTLRGATDF